MSTETVAQATGVYVCDLAEDITEEELCQIFEHYGDIVSIEQVRDSGCEAVHVGYANKESAKEACSILNYASLRGRTCRCLAGDAIEVIRRTMGTGQRLVFEQLDTTIDSCGLHDVCSLFGDVLDCKVEIDEEHQHGLGFVHFSCEEEASRATTFLSGMQLGSSTVEIRPFETVDSVLFTGCRYIANNSKLCAGNDDNNVFSNTEGKQQNPVPGTPEHMERSVLQVFMSLEYHHMEVLEDPAAKLERLKTLIQLYDPSHETQMVIVVHAASIQPVAGVLSQCLEDCDYASLELSTSQEDRKAILEGYDTGNLYVVTVSSEVCTRREFDLGKPASVLINFDCPPTVPMHLCILYKRAASSTRVHNFFSPKADSRLALPLLKALEEAGHEIPPELLKMWSMMDQKGTAARDA